MENVNDLWFNTFTLTNTGSVTFERGKFDLAAKFNGTSQELSRTSTTDLNPKLSAWTIIMYFRAIDDQPNAGELDLIQKFVSSNGISF